MSEAKQAFAEEQLERKRMLKGARARTGRHGHSAGSMRTPADILTGAERREYEKSGEVMISSIYDTVLPVAQFRALSKRERTLHLYEWKKRFSTKQISEGLGINLSQTYYLLKTHGIQCNKMQMGEPAASGSSASNGPGVDTATETSSEQPPTARPSNEPTDTQAEQAAHSAGTEQAYTAASQSPRTLEVQMHGEWNGTDVAAKLQGLAKMACGTSRCLIELTWREL